MADVPYLLTTHQVQDVLGKAMQTQTVVMLYFTATWCGPCKKIKPFVQQLQAEHAPKLAVYAIDIDHVDAGDNKLVDHFQIKSVPTFIFVRQNQVVGISAGANQQALHEKTSQVLQC